MRLAGRANFFDNLFKVRPTQTIVLGFAAIILVGTLLLNLPIAARNGQSPGFTKALFTATSATCVTGLVVEDTYTYWTVFGQTVILFLIQIGGLGFMTMATLFSFILRRRISLKERLVIVESLNQYNLQGIVGLIRKVLIGTFVFEGAGAILLSIRFSRDFGLAGGIYRGVFHAVSAFCNAGFDLMGQSGKFSSLAPYADDAVVNLTVIGLIITGGLGFAVWDDVYRTKNFRDLHLHSKLVLTTTGLLLLAGFLVIFLLEMNNAGTLGSMNWRGKLLASLFHSVTPRTAGFNTLSLPDMRSASLLVTMLLMFIGGSPGSTAGGIKTTTAGVLLYTVVAVIRGRQDTEMFKRRISHTAVVRSFTITFISAVLIVFVTIALTIAENVSLLEAMFESVSAFGTVGLSLGITPGLGSVSRMILIAAMFLGRVGVLTMALALLSRSQSTGNNYRYREEKIMVG